MDLVRPDWVTALCRTGYEAAGGGNDKGTAAAKAYLTIGNADYTAVVGAEITGANLGSSNSCATQLQPVAAHSKTSVRQIIQRHMDCGKWRADTLRVLDLGCGDGEILQSIQRDFGLAWENLVGITAEDLRGFFDEHSPRFGAALVGAFEPLREQLDCDNTGVAQWLDKTICMREKCLENQQGAKKARGYANLSTTAPAWWNEEHYIVHDIHHLREHGGLAVNVNEHGRFNLITSWVTACYLFDVLSVLEYVYNNLLAANGGVMVVQGVFSTCVGGSEAALGQLASSLRSLGVDFRVFDWHADTNQTLLTVTKHETSPPSMNLGSLLEYKSRPCSDGPRPQPSDAMYELRERPVSDRQ